MMDATTLRQAQRPLKKQYRDDPDSAQVQSRAQARVGDGITSDVATDGGETVAGLHRATGGDGTKVCSADLLLQALVGCAGVTLKSVATTMHVDVDGTEIRATGTWDARGTLGVDKETPVGISDIELVFDLDTNADRETREKLIARTERYCVIYQTLCHSPRVEIADRSHTSRESRR